MDFREKLLNLSSQEEIFVQKTQMGTTEAYLGTVTLEWVASRLRFAAQLPLFQSKFDPKTNNIIRDATTIEQLQQRPLDWSRQALLAQYLAVRKHHKFPALLVVLSPPWVDDPEAETWQQQRALHSAANFTALDEKGQLGFLDISANIAIFALDGQHRLMGIQGLMELLKTGQLTKYNKYKKPTGTVLTIANLSKEYNLDPAYLQNLAQENIGIEFIPAVVKGETREEARRRVRSIFVHVNLMSINLSKGQLALLNEDDGFSIVARNIAVTHPLFREEEGRNPRVNWDSATVAAKATVLTTLQALKDMAEAYLKPKFPHWQPLEKGLIPLRPEDEELELGSQELAKLFDNLATLPSYKKLEKGADTPQLRRFSHEQGKGEANILFRPVGQIALVQALGILVTKKKLKLKTIFSKLRQYDKQGRFSGMEFPSSPWYGVLYDPQKKRIQISGKDLASKLIIYLVAGIEDELDYAKLRTAVAKARTVGENQAMGFNGEIVKPKEVGLPEQFAGIIRD
ncbi:MAG: DGQHR domain-containing protein [Spirulinaceae cyanobacterium]